MDTRNTTNNPIRKEDIDLTQPQLQSQRYQPILVVPMSFQLWWTEHRIPFTFWCLGLLNNTPYVIMIASAKSISEGGTALVFLANILPGLCIKLTGPYWFDKVGYNTRILTASIFMGLSFSTVAFFSNFSESESSSSSSSSWNQNVVCELIGVAFTSAQGGLGEASLLALAGKYDSSYTATVTTIPPPPTTTRRSTRAACITSYSSGTGLAGVFGFFWVFVWNHWLGCSLPQTLWIATSLPLCYAYMYVTHLWNHGSDHHHPDEPNVTNGDDDSDVEIETVNVSSWCPPKTKAMTIESSNRNSTNNNDNNNTSRRSKYTSGKIVYQEARQQEEDVPLQPIGIGTEEDYAYASSSLTFHPSSQAIDAKLDHSLEKCYYKGQAEEHHCNISAPATVTAPATIQKVDNMTTQQRLQLVLSLYPYMIPLFVVYAAEYILQAGTWTAIGFPVDDSNARDTFYEYSNWMYQAGVFVSRSSGTIYMAPLSILWIMPLLQTLNVVFFSWVAKNHIWYNYTLLIPCFYVGLLGGGVYVNAYTRICADLISEHREFALAATSVAESLGIVVADILGLFLQSCLYKANGLDGAAVTCPIR